MEVCLSDDTLALDGRVPTAFVRFGVGEQARKLFCEHVRPAEAIPGLIQAGQPDEHIITANNAPPDRRGES